MLDRNNAKVLHREIIQAIADIAAKYGMELEPSNARLTPDSFRKRLVLNRVITAEERKHKETAVDQEIQHICLMNRWQVTSDKTGETLVKYVPRRKRFPFLIKTMTGKLMKCTAKYLDQNFRKAA